MEKTKEENKPKKNRTLVCLFCGVQYSNQNVDIHMHSYVHHKGIEHLKLRGQHKCLACNVFVTGLKPYKEHISTSKHTYSLYNLHKKKSKEHFKEYNIRLTKDENVARQRAQKKNKALVEWCLVCCQYFPAQSLNVHMHSVFHHEMIEKLKGSPQVHKCLACGTLETGLAQFKQHLGTAHHEISMFALEKDAAEGIKVDYSADIDDELRYICAQRDQIKKTRKEEKKKREMEMKKMLNYKKKGRHRHKVVMENLLFTNDHLQPLYHLESYLSWQHQNNHLASIDPTQNMSKRRQESMFDMNRSNEPLVKKPRFETQPAIYSQKVTASDTLPIHEGVEVWVNSLLSQSRIEASKPNMTTAEGETTANEAAIPSHSQKRLSHANEPAWTFNRTASHNEQDTSDGTNRQEPYIDSHQSATSLAETFESQTSENDWQDISHSLNSETIKSKVNELLMLSAKEEELSLSLEHVGEQLIQTHFTLEGVRAEVQRLLDVKQQVTSEMTLLRERRLKILQQMKDIGERSSNSDQQVVLIPPDSCVKL